MVHGKGQRGGVDEGWGRRAINGNAVRAFRGGKEGADNGFGLGIKRGEKHTRSRRLTYPSGRRRLTLLAERAREDVGEGGPCQDAIERREGRRAWGGEGRREKGRELRKVVTFPSARTNTERQG